jgi:hypothetical protein
MKHCHSFLSTGLVKLKKKNPLTYELPNKVNIMLWNVDVNNGNS